MTPSPSGPTAIRVPPHSIEAEQAVLGGLLVTPAAFDRVADRLLPGDFYRGDHRAVYFAMTELVASSLPIDLVTLGDWFASRPESTRPVDGYLTTLFETTAGATNVVAYADIVRERSILRQLVDVGGELAGIALLAGPLTSAEVIDRVEQRLFIIAEHRARARDGAVSIRHALRDAFQILRRRAESPTSMTGVPSGFADLDRLTTGFQDGDLILLAGRPSMGKSAIAVQMAAHAALEHGCGAGVFALEMSASQLALRLISLVGRIDQQRFRTGNLDEAEWAAATRAVDRLADARLFVDDTPALTISELRSRARRLKREFGIGLLVVDYLQLMHVAEGSENRATEVAMISRSLKALAKELGIPIIALSQLSRGLEKRSDRRPVMSDLRESGALEQDADLILFLYRDDYYNPDSVDRGVAELIVGKQRNGPVGTVRLTFLAPFTAFANYARETA